METDIQERFNVLEDKIDATFKSAEKTRKYMQAIMWITVVAVVLPIAGLIFAIPAFMNTYLGSFDGLL